MTHVRPDMTAQPDLLSQLQQSVTPTPTPDSPPTPDWPRSMPSQVREMISNGSLPRQSVDQILDEYRKKDADADQAADAPKPDPVPADDRDPERRAPRRRGRRPKADSSPPGESKADSSPPGESSSPPRGRPPKPPTKADRRKLILACAAGGVAPALVREYLEIFEGA